MRFTHLDQSTRSVQLAAGTLDVRLLHGTDGTTTIDTPSITVEPRRAGSYRVTVTPDGQTLVTVRAGDAQINTPQGSQDLQPGSTLVAQGEAANPSIQTEAAIALDDFDHFNAERDRADTPAVADAAFVNPDIGGVEDLDANGKWVVDGSYGHVWVPANVGPDWAPYRDGRWVWEEGYGWTWIAAEPWGWAPYHYGSWYNSPAYGWCWYPPQPAVFVPWRPALVAFIGFGGGGGFSLGFGGGAAFGSIGWVPLAPFEPYHPWWGNRYGYGYGPAVTNINVNITNVTVYKNVQYNAVTSVTSQRFLQGNFTHNVPVPQAQLAQAHVFRGAIPVVPTASNLRFTNSAAPPAVRVRSGLLAQSFAGKPATAVQRTPFAAQRVALATTTHAPLTPLHFTDAQTTPLVQNHALEQSAPQPGRAATQSAPAAGTQNAWSRFNATRSPEGTTAHDNATTHDNPATHDNATTRDNSAVRENSSTRENATTRENTAPEHTSTIPSYGHADTETNRAPADTYHAPADTYHAPASDAKRPTDTYRVPPADTYHAPQHSANTETGGYPTHASAQYRAAHAPAPNAHASAAPKHSGSPAPHAQKSESERDSHR
jgi:hypothetical protein